MSASSKHPTKWLIWYLRLIGISAQLAFLAAIMPGSWVIEITEKLNLEPFPETPVAFYLARHLSLMYGFLGIALIGLSYHIDRYRELVYPLAAGTILFGAMQGWIDFQSGMPMGWTVSESASSMTGGVIMLWLHRSCNRVRLRLP